jgi:hypothetical protein
MTPRKFTRELVRERISSIKPVEHYIEAMDATVYLRVMSGQQRDQLEASIIGHRAPTPGGRIHIENIRARTMAYCICNEDGTLIYDPHNPKDLDELGALDIQVSQSICKRCQELNALSDEDVNTLAKKSQETQNTRSGLPLQSPLDIDQNESANNGSIPMNSQNG